MSIPNLLERLTTIQENLDALYLKRFSTFLRCNSAVGDRKNNKSKSFKYYLRKVQRMERRIENQQRKQKLF